jgi:hypothetical protein
MDVSPEKVIDGYGVQARKKLNSRRLLAENCADLRHVVCDPDGKESDKNRDEQMLDGHE